MESEKHAIKLLLSHIGEDVSRKELALTPERILSGYENIFSGYKIDCNKIIHGNFSNAENNEIILFDKIDFFSTCEHHFMPFFGEIQIAYIPKHNAIGFNTILSLVDGVTRRLQLQERVTKEIAEILQESTLEPLGVFVMVSANHFCTLSKSSKNSKPSMMKTLFTTGEFKKPESVQKINLLLL